MMKKVIYLLLVLLTACGGGSGGGGEPIITEPADGLTLMYFVNGASELVAFDTANPQNKSIVASNVIHASKYYVDDNNKLTIGGVFYAVAGSGFFKVSATGSLPQIPVKVSSKSSGSICIGTGRIFISSADVIYYSDAGADLDCTTRDDNGPLFVVYASMNGSVAPLAVPNVVATLPDHQYLVVNSLDNALERYDANFQFVETVLAFFKTLVNVESITTVASSTGEIYTILGLGGEIRSYSINAGLSAPLFANFAESVEVDHGSGDDSVYALIDNALFKANIGGGNVAVELSRETLGTANEIYYVSPGGYVVYRNSVTNSAGSISDLLKVYDPVSQTAKVLEDTGVYTFLNPIWGGDEIFYNLEDANGRDAVHLSLVSGVKTLFPNTFWIGSGLDLTNTGGSLSEIYAITNIDTATGILDGGIIRRYDLNGQVIHDIGTVPDGLGDISFRKFGDVIGLLFPLRWGGTFGQITMVYPGDALTGQTQQLYIFSPDVPDSLTEVTSTPQTGVAFVN